MEISSIRADHESFGFAFDVKVVSLYETSSELTTEKKKFVKSGVSKEIDKETFCEVVDKLAAVFAKSQKLNEEMGIDLAFYELDYLLILDTLMRGLFSDGQLYLISYYLYDIPEIRREDPSFKSNVRITDEALDETEPLENSEDLWNLIQKLKDSEDGKV